MKSFRFVHTADIHLDSPLKGLSGHEGRVADRIRTATREAFDNLIGKTIDEEADFIIIAGDLYDGEWRDYHTGLFFTSQMGRLAKAGIPALVLYGNHDAESQITRRLELPENVHAFSERKPETFTLDELRVALHGQSFRQREVTDNLVPAYPRTERARLAPWTGGTDPADLRDRRTHHPELHAQLAGQTPCGALASVSQRR